jgi:hypothetical protein
LKDAEATLRALPPEVVPDEQQPWFGKVYAYVGGYYLDNGIGGWSDVTETNAERELRNMGISNLRDTPTTSPLDRTFLALQKRHKVDYAGPLAGYKAGVTEQNGLKVLVTKPTKIITPEKGAFPVINAILNGLVRDKRKYIDAYVKNTYEGLELCLETGKNDYGPVLVLAGPKNCGKSLFQLHILTPLLGGRAENPYQYMTGDTPFNSELTGAGHLMLEDESAAKDIRTRVKFGTYIKKFAANKMTKSHGKRKEGISVFPFQRLSVSVNDESEHLEVLPPIDESLSDKIIILRCFPFKLPMPTATPREKMAFEATIAKELPAYIHWVLNEFETPEEIKASANESRYGFKIFQDPEILEAIEGTAPETQLVELLERRFFEKELFEDYQGTSFRMNSQRTLRTAHWITMGTAAQVFEKLQDNISQTGAAARKLLSSPKACGIYLARLATKHPELIRQYRGNRGMNKYQIWCDPERYLAEEKGGNLEQAA